MNAPNLQSLVDRFRLPAGARDQLDVLAQLLEEDPLAPTTVREPTRVRDDHLADSLVALELDVVRDARALLDVGAGAGLPGLPLAVALPGAHITLIDASTRKCEFITMAAGAMGLANVEVQHARAEELNERNGAFDVVTARALAPLDVVAEYAAPLLSIGGHLVAWRGRREPQVEAEGLKAAQILGLSVLDPIEVQPYPQVEHRYLHLMSKVSETPSRFPRRAGMARKRPLGVK